MATPVLATFTEVSDTFEHGPIPESERTRVEWLIRRASARLVRIVPSIVARMQSGELDPRAPGDFVIEAVLRSYRNPSGAMSQMLGPFTIQNDRTQKSTADAITFDEVYVHEVLDPHPINAAESIAIGIPCQPSQMAAGGLWGSSWYDNPGVGLWGV